MVVARSWPIWRRTLNIKYTHRVACPQSTTAATWALHIPPGPGASSWPCRWSPRCWGQASHRPRWMRASPWPWAPLPPAQSLGRRRRSQEQVHCTRPGCPCRSPGQGSVGLRGSRPGCCIWNDINMMLTLLLSSCFTSCPTHRNIQPNFLRARKCPPRPEWPGQGRCHPWTWRPLQPSAPPRSLSYLKSLLWMFWNLGHFCQAQGPLSTPD